MKNFERALIQPEPEGEKIFNDVFFEPVLNKKGKIIYYKSSADGRKSIEIKTDEDLNLGRGYKVRIIKDTNPDDSQTGKYIGEIIFDSEEKINSLTEDGWKKVEGDIGEAEKIKRIGNRASVDLRRATGLNKAQRDELSNQRILDKTNRPRLVKEALTYEEEAEKKVAQYIGEEGSPQRALIDLEWRNLAKALRARKLLDEKLTELLKEEEQIESGVEGEASLAELGAIKLIRNEISKTEEEIEHLYSSSPEAFYGLHLKELKEYKANLEGGKIVETPYVKKHITEILPHLRSGSPVLIYGELGSGKTELAIHISKNYILKDREDLKESDRIPLIISGSKNTPTSELFGHQTLSVEKIKKEEMDEFVKEVETKYQEWERQNPNAGEGDKDRAHDRYLQTYLSQFKSGTISKYYLGPIYKAMEDGRPVIIDEFNSIPHEVLGSLNHLLTRRAGEVVNVQQDSGKTITIKEGYAVIMTGNLNQGKERYVGRQELDPAFLSRFNKVEYDYLPQTTEGPLKTESGEDNELFQLLISRVMDAHGNIVAPGDTPNKLWNLAKAARLTQNVFSGKEIKNDYYFKAGGARSTRYVLKEAPLSLRHLNNIVRNWKESQFRYELDYYIYKSFIASVTEASDRAYLYQIFKDQFNFFSGDGWEQKPNYGTGGIVNSFEIKVPTNEPSDNKFLGPRETVELAYGKAPGREKWPGKIKEPEPEVIKEENPKSAEKKEGRMTPEGLKEFDDRALDFIDKQRLDSANKNNLAQAMAGLEGEHSMRIRTTLLAEGASADSILVGLAGVDTPEAWELRLHLVKQNVNNLPAMIEGLAGIDSQQAWERRITFQKSKEEYSNHHYYLMRSLTGLDRPRAWQMRGEIMANPDYLKFEKHNFTTAESIAGLNSAPAWELRKKLIEKGEINCAAISLAGIATPAAHEMRRELLARGVLDTYLFDGLAGVDTPEAWELRDKYLNNEEAMKDGKTRFHLAKSLAGLNSPRAWAMRAELRKIGAGRSEIALGLSGDLLTFVWRLNVLKEGKESEKNETSLEKAKEIMGEQFFGPGEVEKAFDLIIDAAEVPPIPFSPDQLELAKAKGLDLILYVNQWSDRNNITGQSIVEKFENKKQDDTPLLASIDWYKAQDFFTRDMPRSGWRLVSRGTIPNSESKNYLEQTEVLKTYLEGFTELGASLGKETVEAIEEFEEVKKKNPKLADWVKSTTETEWKKAAEILAGLKLNKEFRESFVDWLYRTVLAERAKGLTILPSLYSWTNSRESSGFLVRAGGSDADGAFVDGWLPWRLDSALGAAFSAGEL